MSGFLFFGVLIGGIILGFVSGYLYALDGFDGDGDNNKKNP